MYRSNLCISTITHPLAILSHCFLSAACFRIHPYNLYCWITPPMQSHCLPRGESLLSCLLYMSPGTMPYNINAASNKYVGKILFYFIYLWIFGGHAAFLFIFASRSPNRFFFSFFWCVKCSKLQSSTEELGICDRETRVAPNSNLELVLVLTRTQCTRIPPRKQTVRSRSI